MKKNHPISVKNIEQMLHAVPWIFYLGIALIISGALAVLFARQTSLIELEYLGGFLIILGFFEGVHSFKITQWGTFFLHEFMSILYIVGGLLIALDPIADEAVVTLLHAFFFISSGILRIIFSFEQITRPHVRPHAPKWLLLNGTLTCIIGLCVAYEWPEKALWVIGALIGIDAIMTGWTWMMLSYEGRKLQNK